MGECDVTDCHQTAVTVIVGEAGDLWLCAEHAPECNPSPVHIPNAWCDGGPDCPGARTDGSQEGS